MAQQKLVNIESMCHRSTKNSPNIKIVVVDKIKSEVIKYCHNNFEETYLILMNNCCKNKLTQPDWNEATVIPILKNEKKYM